MIIRIRSSIGQFKINIPDDLKSTFGDLQNAIQKESSIPPNLQKLARDINGEELLKNDPTSLLSSINITNGSVLFVIGRLEKTTVHKSFIKEGGEVISAGASIVVDKSDSNSTDHTSEKKDLTDVPIINKNSSSDEQSYQPLGASSTDTTSPLNTNITTTSSVATATPPGVDDKTVQPSYNSYNEYDFTEDVEEVLRYDDKDFIRPPDKSKTMNLMSWSPPSHSNSHEPRENIDFNRFMPSHSHSLDLDAEAIANFRSAGISERELELLQSLESRSGSRSRLSGKSSSGSTGSRDSRGIGYHAATAGTDFARYRRNGTNDDISMRTRSNSDAHAHGQRYHSNNNSNSTSNNTASTSASMDIDNIAVTGSGTSFADLGLNAEELELQRQMLKLFEEEATATTQKMSTIPNTTNSNTDRNRSSSFNTTHSNSNQNTSNNNKNKNKNYVDSRYGLSTLPFHAPSSPFDADLERAMKESLLLLEHSEPSLSSSPPVGNISTVRATGTSHTYSYAASPRDHSNNSSNNNIRKTNYGGAYSPSSSSTGTGTSAASVRARARSSSAAALVKAGDMKPRLNSNNNSSSNSSVTSGSSSVASAPRNPYPPSSSSSSSRMHKDLKATHEIPSKPSPSSATSRHSSSHMMETAFRAAPKTSSSSSSSSQSRNTSSSAASGGVASTYSSLPSPTVTTAGTTIRKHSSASDSTANTSANAAAAGSSGQRNDRTSSSIYSRPSSGRSQTSSSHSINPDLSVNLNPNTPRRHRDLTSAVPTIQMPMQIPSQVIRKPTYVNKSNESTESIPNNYNTPYQTSNSKSNTNSTPNNSNSTNSTNSSRTKSNLFSSSSNSKYQNFNDFNADLTSSLKIHDIADEDEDEDLILALKESSKSSAVFIKKTEVKSVVPRKSVTESFPGNSGGGIRSFHVHDLTRENPGNKETSSHSDKSRKVSSISRASNSESLSVENVQIDSTEDDEAIARILEEALNGMEEEDDNDNLLRDSNYQRRINNTQITEQPLVQFLPGESSSFPGHLRSQNIEDLLGEFDDIFNSFHATLSPPEEVVDYSSHRPADIVSGRSNRSHSNFSSAQTTNNNLRARVDDDVGDARSRRRRRVEDDDTDDVENELIERAIAESLKTA